MRAGARASAMAVLQVAGARVALLVRQPSCPVGSTVPPSRPLPQWTSFLVPSSFPHRMVATPWAKTSFQRLPAVRGFSALPRHPLNQGPHRVTPVITHSEPSLSSRPFSPHESLTHLTSRYRPSFAEVTCSVSPRVQRGDAEADPGLTGLPVPLACPPLRAQAQGAQRPSSAESPCDWRERGNPEQPRSRGTVGRSVSQVRASERR